MTSSIKAALTAVGLMALSGCQMAKERVFDRVPSPDGVFEAVLMICQTPADRTKNDLVVAIYDEKGRDCDKPYVDVVTGVSLTHPYAANAIKAEIYWEGTTLVVKSLDERLLISGVEAGVDAPRATIRIDGPVGGLYRWNERAAPTPQAASARGANLG